GDIEGLNLLEVTTTFRPGKIVRPVRMRPAGQGSFLQEGPSEIEGYEIHSGVTVPLHGEVLPAFYRIAPGKAPEGEGVVSRLGSCFGTSVHGLFEADLFRRQFVNVLRKRKGLPMLAGPAVNFTQIQETEFDRWARLVEAHLDWPLLNRILKG
ncbi:MAG TPA: hypothetical protein VFA47_10440, partial [Candidatus Manganitrophaceae bacterium]|nr:hypothetical protein [Candidatus Manganitrophaceae bacterium]